LSNYKHNRNSSDISRRRAQHKAVSTNTSTKTYYSIQKKKKERKKERKERTGKRTMFAVKLDNLNGCDTKFWDPEV